MEIQSGRVVVTAIIVDMETHYKVVINGEMIDDTGRVRKLRTSSPIHTADSYVIRSEMEDVLSKLFGEY